MTINLLTTDHSVHHTQVEWDVLTRIISDFAYFESNKAEIVKSIYLERSEELAEEFVRTQSYLSLMKDEYRSILAQTLSRIGPDAAVERFIGHIAKSGVLSFSELNKVARLIESGIFLRQDFPELNLSEVKAIQGLDYQPVQRKFLREFRHLVDESGEVHFDRHPELSELNRRLRELEEKIRRTVQEWLTDAAHQKVLQFGSYDIHHDRFVVPVRSDSYRSELGFIISRSESGQTLYVEPFEVREACNRRMELIAKIDELINQLALKFSHALAEHASLLYALYRDFLRLDHYLAKSAFAYAYALERPSIRQDPGFKFTGLFHPLIKNAVKNTADCAARDHGIVISGPNTGGKTVFLKSITLSYLLFYHGFFVPAAEAELFPYEGVFYFGNDLQNLQTGLSSFSGEVKNYIELMENLWPSNLILIDEIFNSTSSDEASALSLAYFDELHKRGTCHIVVSTHHQMFKTLVHQDRRYVSCHVGFDTKNMKPTYKVQWGTPGASMAIDIFRILARGHDLVKDIPEKALAQMSTKNVSYETLLQKVSQKQIELDQLLTSNRQLEVELKNQKGAMEGVLNLKLQDELAKARKEVDRIIAEARELVDEARRNEITKVKKVDDKAIQLKARITELRGEAPEPQELQQHSDLDLAKLKVGDMVYSFVLKKEFLVQAIDQRKREVVIGKGPIKMSVPASTLGSSKKAAQAAKVSVSFQRNNDAKMEYDARGMRLSEFQNMVEAAMGDLMAGDIPYLHIIHGHGDGTLKNWLRDHLKKSKDFAMEVNDSGNDGETRIILR